MKKYSLGKTGIMVTELCFGALPIGPLQANISLENGKAVVNHKLCLLCGYCNPVCPEFAIRII